MKILIPHLGYAVYVKSHKNNKLGYEDTFALCERNNADSSTIYIDTPISKNKHSTLAHEIVHVLQNICQDRGMDFVFEREHMGYLMQYIYNEITGLTYK